MNTQLAFALHGLWKFTESSILKKYINTILIDGGNQSQSGDVTESDDASV